MAEPPFISGDSHLEIHPKNWVDRVPAQHRDRAPRLTRLSDGSDAFLIEGSPARRLPIGDIYGGQGRENWGPIGLTFENTPGTGSPEQRIREQHTDGIAAEVLFPGQQTGPRLWRSVSDDDAYLAMVRAWNSWLAEDYCSVDRSRLIGLGVIPWTGVDDAVAEMERCASMGLGGVVLGMFPSTKAYPVPDDDRFWAAAIDMNMPVTIHVELDRRGSRDNALFQYPPGYARAGADRGIVELLANPKFAMLGAVNAVQLMFAGVFDRFPRLRLFFAETQIGWIPHFLEQVDEWYEWHRYSAERRGLPPLQRKPSEYIREHCYWGFQYNPVGVEMRRRSGIDRLIWATDFPHMGSEYPETRTRVLARNFDGVPAEDVYRMVCGNVCEFFGLDEEAYGA